MFVDEAVRDTINTEKHDSTSGTVPEFIKKPIRRANSGAINILSHMPYFCKFSISHTQWYRERLQWRGYRGECRTLGDDRYEIKRQ